MMPTTLTLGTYTVTSRFMIVQHKYVGSGPEEPGYMQMLEILDPPNGKTPFVIHQYQMGTGNRFWQFDSRVEAWDAWPSDFPIWSRLLGQDVKVRFVHSSTGIPWFYAENDHEVTAADFFER